MRLRAAALAALLCAALLGGALRADAQSLVWKSLTPNGALTAHESAVLNSKLYVFGGFSTSDFSLAAYVTPLASISWSTFNNTAAVVKRRDFASFVYNSKIYIFGGYGDTYLNDVWEYTDSDNTWRLFSTSGTQPVGRYGHTMVLIGTNAYLFGGIDSGGTVLSTVHRLAMTTGVWTLMSPSGSAPGARAFHSATVANSCMYVTSGRDATTTTTYSTHHSYCPSGNAWTSLGLSGPTPRYGHRAFARQNRVVLFGGRDASGNFLLDMWFFDPNLITWRSINDITGTAPTGRVFTSLADDSTSVYLYGGEDAGGALNTLFSTNYTVVLCNPGYYSPYGNSTCAPCSGGNICSATGCYSCSACAQGSYTNGTAQSACNLCSGGTYSLTATGASSSSVCSKCNAGQYSPTSGATVASVCTSCPRGSYSTASGSSFCQLCAAGNYSTTLGATTSSACIKCATGSFTASTGLSLCTTCSAGQYQNATGATFCYTCGTGTYSGASQSFCNPCAAGTYNPSSNKPSSTNCLSCAQGTYSNTSAMSFCWSCIPGTYNAATGASSVTFCTSCSVGTFNTVWGATAASICASCSAGSYNTGSGLTYCTLCPVATYSVYAGATSLTHCLDCPAGRYSNNQGNSQLTHCSACTPGSWSAQKSTSCTDCVSGTYSTVSQATSSTVCFDCNSGTFSAAGSSVCGSCATNSYSWGGSTICYSCSSTFTNASQPLNQQMDTVNATANPARFSYWQGWSSGYTVSTTGGRNVTGVATLNAIEMNNTIGTLSLEARQTVVLNQTQAYALLIDAWSDGTNVTGSADSAYAVKLDVTFTDGTTDSTFYVSFAVGTKFYENVNEYYFPAKPIAQYTVRLVFGTPHTGIVHFDNVNVSQVGTEVACTCSAGEYYKIEASGTCHSCTLGKYCINGKRGSCSGAYFSFGRSSFCTSCLPGWICSSGIGLPCLNTTYATAFNGTCSSCPSGSKCSNGQRSTCETGFYGTGGSICQICAPGTYSFYNGSSNCTSCPAGYTSNMARSACLQCTPGTYSTNGTRCYSCPAGTSSGYGAANSCTPCAAGTYMSHVGGELCDRCSIGFYASGTGNTGCTQCAGGLTTLSAGATSSAACV